MHERWIHLGPPESALGSSQWLRGERRISTGVVPAKVGLLIKWGSCHTLKGNFDSRSKSHFLVKSLTSWQMFWAPISFEERWSSTSDDHRTRSWEYMEDIFCVIRWKYMGASWEYMGGIFYVIRWMLPERMKGAGYWSLSLASTDLTLDSEHDKGKREISMSTRMNENDIYNISME